MKAFWKSTAALLTTILIVLMPVANATAQRADTAGDTFESELTGEEIDLGTSGYFTFLEDDYDLRENRSFSEEYIWFTGGWSNFQVVMIDGPSDSESYTDTTLSNMEQFYDPWAVVDQEINDDDGWFVGVGGIDDDELVVFYSFQADVFGDMDMVVMQFSDPSAFADDMTTAQEEVTIGGSPVFEGFDGEEIQAMIGDGSESTPESDDEDDNTSETGTSRTSRTSATTDDEDDEADADATAESESSGNRTSRTSSTGVSEDEDAEETSGNRTSRTSRGETQDDDADNVEEDVESSPVAGGDWSDMGLISDTEWESPSYGTTITWDDSIWQFPSDFDSAILINEDPAYDILTIETVDGLGYTYVTVDYVYESTPDSLIEYWQSPEYAEQYSNGIEILETGTTATSATLVYETTNNIDQPLMVVLEATFLDDDTVIFSQISASPDTIGDVYEYYIDGVEINGAPIDATFTVEDIRDIAGN